MECIRIASYFFDVGFDIATGINFLEGRNYSEGNGTNVLEEDQSTIPDTAWGTLTLCLVFMPGWIVGVVAGMGTIIVAVHRNCRWMAPLLGLVVAAFFPVIQPIIFIYYIMILMPKEDPVDESDVDCLPKIANWLIIFALGLSLPRSVASNCAATIYHIKWL